jgi:hypothetical protein
MKKLDSVDELKEWEHYREFLKESLKLLDDEEPCFVSKDKVEFEVEEGKTWNGHAFLAGKKAILSVKNLKKGGVIFREGLCKREGKDLHISGIKPAKLCKEAEKTFLRLRLGYKVIPMDEPEDQDAAMTPEVRKKKVDELQKLQTDLDRLLAALK